MFSIAFGPARLHSALADNSHTSMRMVPGDFCGRVRWVCGSAVLLACLLSQGCVGVGVMRTKNNRIDDPFIKDVASIDAVTARYGSERNGAKYTAQWLEARWGKPASVEHTSNLGSEELWTYKFDRSWCGLVPMVIVPIPLALPVARYKIQFALRNGQVESAEQGKGQFSGVGAGIVGPDGWGCWGGASADW